MNTVTSNLSSVIYILHVYQALDRHDAFAGSFMTFGHLRELNVFGLL